MAQDKHHSHGGGHGGHGGGGGGGGVGVASRHGGDGGVRKPFADGTTDFPTPIQGLGSALTAAANGGNVTPLTPVPKTGFVGQFNHQLAGNLTVGTLGTNYQIPLHRILANYSLVNSLQYPYRNLNYDDVWFWANIGQQYTGPLDSIYGSGTLQMPVVTSTGAKAYQFSFTDWIGLNDGANFSKYLLSALTNSNDLTILITWLNSANLAYLGANGNVVTYTAYTASDAVSCVYNTVPNADEWYWPDTSKVQQCIGDPSFGTLAAGAQNNVNLTPISGPDFLGIGIQVIWNTSSAGWLVDPLTPAGSGINQIALLVGGTIPLKTYTLSDMIRAYEMRFGRTPAYGYLYIDMTTDMGLPNNMSQIMRKALATTKYAQLTLQVITNANQTAGAGAKINVFKRTQQQYAGNAAVL
jgi:hypothetical protein